MQHAIDAEAHDAELAPRLDVDVGGALLEGVLPQPVDDGDNVLVVGIELSVGLAQFNELLEGRQARGSGIGPGRLLDRAREVVELDLEAADVERIGDHPPDVLAQDGQELSLPLADEGLRGGDHDFLGGDLHRKDAKTRRIGV